MKNLAQMMKQAQEMQGKMQDLQERLENKEISGASGAGMVSITLNGKGQMRSLKVDPGLLSPDQAEVLEDLIVAAHNDAGVRGPRGASEQSIASEALRNGPHEAGSRWGCRSNLEPQAAAAVRHRLDWDTLGHAPPARARIARTILR